MKKLLLSLCCVLAAIQLLTAQSYYPLELSNHWFYKVDWGSDDIFVVSDSVFSNGKHYFVLNKPDFTGGQYVRVDSQFVYYFDPSSNRDVPFFSLNGNVGDTTQPNAFMVFKVELVKIDTVMIFDESTRVLSYDLTLLTLRKIQLSDKFGPVYAAYYDDPPAPWPMDEYNLTGCILSDSTYGNTTSVHRQRTVRKQFALFRNYPNPFNPNTTIEFYLSKDQNVTIEILTLKGELIETLISKPLHAGNHKIIWRAHNLASGIYLCRLRTGAYSRIKKLTLLR